MAYVTDVRKERIRNYCIQGAQEYCLLLNKVYLIISDTNELFEVTFCAEDFKHLTGVKSSLGDKSFYRSCYKKTFTRNNVASNQTKDWNSLKGKEKGILNIRNILYSDADDVLILDELITNTAIFPIALRNDNKDIAVAFDTEYKARSIRKARHSLNVKRTMNIQCIVSKNCNSSLYTDLVYLNSRANKMHSSKFLMFSESLCNEINDKIKKLTPGAKEF